MLNGVQTISKAADTLIVKRICIRYMPSIGIQPTLFIQKK